MSAEKPIFSEKEKERILNLRRLSQARRTLILDEMHGNLAEGDTPKLENMNYSIVKETEKLIWESEFSALSGKANTSGIQIENNAREIVLTVPSLSEHFGNINIHIAKRNLSTEIVNLLPASEIHE